MRKIQEHEGGGGFSPFPVQNSGSSFMMNTMPQQLLMNSLSSFQKSQLSPKTSGLPTQGMQIPSQSLDLIPQEIAPKKSFMESGLGKTIGKVGSFMTGIGGQSLMSQHLNSIKSADKVINSNDALTGGIRTGVNNALMMSGNPFGIAAGAVNMLIDKTGGFTDASKGLGKGTDTLNSIASLAVPGAGWFAGKTKNYTKSQELTGSTGYTGTSATGDKAKQNAGAKLLFGKNKANTMIMRQQQRDNQVQDIVNSGADDLASSASSGYIGQRNSFDLQGGLNRKAALAKEGLKLDRDFAKKAIASKKKSRRLEEVAGLQQGGLVSNLDDLVKRVNSSKANFVKRLNEPTIRTIPSSDGYVMSHKLGYADMDGKTIVFPQVQEIDGKLQYFQDWRKAMDSAIQRKDTLEMSPDEAELFTTQYKTKYPGFKTTKFKEGGSINVIPEGALHARKHHLDDIDEKFEDVTCKGIPVITESEGGSVTQHAEVERNEIIFCLDVTEQLEKLMKEGSDDAAITAGKLLVREILENTEDNTGLIQEVD